jgi:nicotinamide-nucleotide amidase
MKELQELFIKKGLTLSLAESCTGGYVSHLITSTSGSSQYFLGSVVCYSNLLKERALGVSPHLLEKRGAVSKEAALAMCAGIKQLTGSTHCAAITGVAGPLGGTEEKPVGTVWIAVDEEAKCFHFNGSRKEIIHQASDEVFNLIKRLIFPL